MDMTDRFEASVSAGPSGSIPPSDSGESKRFASDGEGPADIRARRRRALGHQGQTGPRGPRGKRRSSLNRLTFGLCPPWLEKDLRARGEDPQEFRRLHRDLIACLNPDDPRGRVMVGMLAETWWEKIRQMRGWVGAGSCDCKEINARIQDLLGRFVWAARLDHRKWRYRLESVLGPGLYGPTVLRERIEARVRLLGGKPPRHRKPAPDPRFQDPFEASEKELARIKRLLAVMFNRPPD
jgi:hypothetical protein